MAGYRDSCKPTEVSFPAAALGDILVARWLRQHRLAVDVHTLAELHSAISVGIHPVLMTVHAEHLDTGDIRRASAAGVGRIVLSCPDQVSRLRTKHTQNALVRMANSSEAEAVAESVIRSRSTRLIGFSCEMNTATVDVVAIADAIAQMDRIRRRHGIVLTRLVLGIGSVIAAEEIDEIIGDACAAMRFPHPAVALSAGH